MVFSLKTSGRNLTDFMRTLGYKPIGMTPEGEMNCVRPLGADYPRFHVYAKESPEGFRISLHLDQKRPSYGGETAHSGEYEGKLVEAEKKRIESLSTGGAGSKPWWKK